MVWRLTDVVSLILDISGDFSARAGVSTPPYHVASRSLRRAPAYAAVDRPAASSGQLDNNNIADYLTTTLLHLRALLAAGEALQPMGRWPAAAAVRRAALLWACPGRARRPASQRGRGDWHARYHKYPPRRQAHSRFRSPSLFTSCHTPSPPPTALSPWLSLSPTPGPLLALEFSRLFSLT